MNDTVFNGIVILDGIPEGEFNTARRLREDLEDIACYLANGLKVRYLRVETIDSLESGISKVIHETRHNDLLPWLHLEGHGISNESGFALASGAQCGWTQLKEIITPLNVSINLNLMLILATCYGGSFSTAIRTSDRAPVLGLIGPTREITIGQVEIGFPTFYRTFFETLSFKKAIEALNIIAPPNLYYGITAERFFYEVWASYKKNECSEEMITKRAKRMYRELKSKKLNKTPSIGHLKRKIHSMERNFFKKFRDTYFMYDLDHYNKTRFPVTYKKADALAMR
jgi:hypothetical protein